MDNIDKILKVVLILSALAFLIVLVVTPKTHCQACEIEYEGKIINGYDAFEIFESACINYAVPWENDIPDINYNDIKEYIYIDIDDINTTTSEDGIPIITFKEGYNESR